MRKLTDRRVNIMIGTAGHIDHGKTELTRLLTGCDTDRLPEEKARGMSIDLGFAPWHASRERLVGIVDVPGHEGFIRNMVAGVTAIDIVLLVVAADDGVMPQTIEHLSIVELLGVDCGLVALTKVDLVDETQRELVADQVRELTQGTFLEGAAICPVSAKTGEGFDAFWHTLRELVESREPRATSGLFRLPVERRFVQRGRGTVVTGIPVSGEVRVGDTLELLPAGLKGRVRALECYKMEDDRARAGECVALNIADLSAEDVQRGDVLCEPGYYEPTRLVAARLHLLRTAAEPLRSRTAIRFHCGTAETMGRVVLLDQDQLPPGAEGLVELHLEAPTVVAPGDRYVLRLHSPVVTIGGGRVIGTHRRRLRRYQDGALADLRTAEATLAAPAERVHQALATAGERGASAADLAHSTLLSPRELPALMEALVAAGRAVPVQEGRRLLAAEAFDALAARLRETLADLHHREPHRAGMPLLALRQALATEQPVFDALLAQEAAAGRVRVAGEVVALAEHHVALDPEQERLLAAAEQAFLAQPFQTPAAEELAAMLRADARQVERLLTVLRERGALVEVEPGLFFHRDAIARAQELLVAELQRRAELLSPEFRDLLGTTRKWAIPLLDYFDRQGVTVRLNGKRVLKRKVE